MKWKSYILYTICHCNIFILRYKVIKKYNLRYNKNYFTEDYELWSRAIEKFPIALNSNLKPSIKIQKAEEVDERFHSRLNCKKKTYRYIINNSENGTAIYRGLEYHVPMKLDYEKMNEEEKNDTTTQ